MLFLTEVYAAGEDPVEGATGAALAHALAARGHADVRFVPDRAALAERLADEAREGDVVLLLGAGDIIKTGPELLTALRGGRPDHVRRVK